MRHPGRNVVCQSNRDQHRMDVGSIVVDFFWQVDFDLGWLSKNGGGRHVAKANHQPTWCWTPQYGPDAKCYFDLTGEKTLGWIPAVSGQRAAQAWTAGTGSW